MNLLVSDKTDVDELTMALKEASEQCYEALRKRQYRAKKKGDTIRYDGYAFLIGVYDAERYMFDKGFAMTTATFQRLEQEYLWETSVAQMLGFDELDLTYLGGVRHALWVANYELVDEIEIC